MTTRAATLIALVSLITSTGCGWSYASQNGMIAPDLDSEPESSPAVIVLEEEQPTTIK